MVQRKGISLNPKHAIKGSNLPDDFDGTIVAAGFEPWTYPNTTIDVIAMFWDVQADGADAPVREHYAAGSPKILQVVGDGCCIDGVEGKEFDGLNDQSVALYALSAVVNAGYPNPEQFDTGDVTALAGARFHFKRMDRKDAGGKTKQSLVPTRYLGAEGSTGKAKGNGAATGEDLTATLQAAVLEVLGDNPDGLTTAVLAQKVNAKLKDNPNRMAALKLVMTKDFLESGPFTFDGKRVSL